MEFIEHETFLRLISEATVPVNVKFGEKYVMTMFNVFISNQSFGDFLNKRSDILKFFQYPNGYMIKFDGNYSEGIIRRTFIDNSLSRKDLKNWKTKFNNLEFDVKFLEGISFNEARKYENNQGVIFEKDGHIHYRQNINYKNETLKLDDLMIVMKNLSDFLPENDKIKYIVWQIEVGAKEKPHIQGLFKDMYSRVWIGYPI